MRLGGKTVSGSGSPWSHDGDVLADDVLVEHKWTSKKSFSLSVSLWDKIYREAWKIGRTPLFGIHLGDGAVDLVLMDEDDFMEMREKALAFDSAKMEN